MLVISAEPGSTGSVVVEVGEVVVEVVGSEVAGTVVGALAGVTGGGGGGGGGGGRLGRHTVRMGDRRLEGR